MSNTYGPHLPSGAYLILKAKGLQVGMLYDLCMHVCVYASVCYHSLGHSLLA